MHLGIVSRYAVAEKGGHERYLQRLCRGLLERGHRVTYFSTCFDDNFKNLDNLKSVEVSCIKFPQPLRYLSFNYFAKKAVAKHREQLDLVFTTEYVTFGDVYRAGAGIQKAEIDAYLGEKAYLSPKNLAKLHLQKRLFTQDPPKKIIANSEKVKEEILNYFPVKEKDIQVIHNGIDTDRFKPQSPAGETKELRKQLSLQEEDKVLLTVGSNIKRKGLDTAINILNELPEEYHLLIAGEPDRKKLLSIASGTVEQRLHFLGRTEKIEKYYRLADWSLVLSRYDPAPNVVLESLACGTPVLITQKTGLSELIASKKLGIVLKGDSMRGNFLDFEQISSAEYSELSQRAAEAGKTFTMKSHLNKIGNTVKQIPENNW